MFFSESLHRIFRRNPPFHIGNGFFSHRFIKSRRFKERGKLRTFSILSFIQRDLHSYQVLVNHVTCIVIKNYDHRITHVIRIPIVPYRKLQLKIIIDWNRLTGELFMFPVFFCREHFPEIVICHLFSPINFLF